MQRACLFQAFSAVRGGDHLEPVPLQAAGEEVARGRIIVDDQELIGAASSGWLPVRGCG